MARELDDAILGLRTSEPELGLWILKTAGNADAVLAFDDFYSKNQGNWFVREVLGMMRRTFARLDVSSRSMFALVEPESCFAGTLLELALAADRVYMLDTQEGDAKSGDDAIRNEFWRAADGESIFRVLAARFYQDAATDRDAARACGTKR